ncbi:diadenylate cyclase CdaA [Risungbinella massiliensis]|uniref:diadenylate cyclase CdaA n=1 Tax=Risungbinella massiliensis TaxID=1329796 RepID=UPI0005CB8271|nr:diadenylate cyclase CdaA [Risungbinella massiliensis]
MFSWDGITSYLNDAVDIAIVSYIIYQLLKLLRGTRAVQLLQGISVVLLFWLFSYIFQLETVGWLLEEILSVGAIAVVVIFQPELRRALEQIGRGGVFGRSRQVEDQLVSKVVGEVSKTVAYLSKRKIGALIVLERQTGLTDYIETGISLQAHLSSELLRNIFLPNTPLHDGAVIVREQTIMAAGCYLPLSESPFITKDLGTRHRAGIGLSENSDAVIVIVSEETGAISLAIHGKLERALTEEGVISRLYEELKPADKKAPSFWHRRNSKEEVEVNE